MQLNREDYRRKVLGCWMGKNIGGTLGAPFEWKRQINDVEFYTQALGGEPLPNDDLDIQLLWLIMLEERGVDITSLTLSEYWCLYVTPHWSEYGTAKANMRSGLVPPLCGSLHNEYKHSCGAFIRSEIWACIAPGCPDIAVRYALQDAILDHGDGEGTYAEIFCAALQSAAFVVSDLRQLLDVGLSYIPQDCGVARAVRCAIRAVDSGMSWREARDEILTHHRGRLVAHVSARDCKKGFDEGRQGYDAPSNVALLILGLLVGGDDFDKMICTTVNCGEDTDCTGATAGAIYGIIHGIEAIPQKWIDPIGRTIKTACLNLGELGFMGSLLPQTVDEMTDRTERVATQVLARHGVRCNVTLSADGPTDLRGLDIDNLKASDHGESLQPGLSGTTHRFDFFTVEVDYGQEPTIRNGQPKTVRVRIRNCYKVQANISLHWYLPEGWTVSPGQDSVVMSLPKPLVGPVEVDFAFSAERVTRATNRCVLELTIEGRPTIMLVPLVLQNGNTEPQSAGGTGPAPK